MARTWIRRLIWALLFTNAIPERIRENTAAVRALRRLMV
jgi:hypothetical protein